MAEVHALQKHPCPECGGDAEWNASKKALTCPYCGTVLPWNDGEKVIHAEILEHDLNQALVSFSLKHQGLRAEKKSVKCESCQAISVFDPDRVAQRCDFCGSPAIVPTENIDDSITPESLLPSIIPSTQVRDQLRTWYHSRWWAPNKLKLAAMTDTVQGIYLPYWTFDAHVEASWTAESGYYYYVSENYRNSEGKTENRQIRKTRWESSKGQLNHFFDDDAVPGTVGVHHALLRKIEPFPTHKELKAYDPAYVRGWTVERYQVDLRKAALTNQQQMDQSVRQLCSRAVPGDTQRNLQVDLHYQSRTFKHILVPVWLVTYTYGTKNYQIIVNGFTGKMAGEHPLSWVKITLAAISALVVVGVILAFNQH